MADSEIEGKNATAEAGGITIHSHHGWDPEGDFFKVSVTKPDGTSASATLYNRDDKFDISSFTKAGETYKVYTEYHNRGGGFDCQVMASSATGRSEQLAYAHGTDWTQQWHNVWSLLTVT